MFGVLASCSSGSSGSSGSGGKAGPATTESVASSTSRPARSNNAVVPGATWDRVTPASVGLDQKALQASAKMAEAGKSKCLAVVRDGALAGEWNFDGSTSTTTSNAFSVTKSVTSILVGIAQDDGDLSLDDHASKWIPQWRDTAAKAVTVRDLLSMDSGRAWSLVSDYVDLIKAKDQTAFAIGLAQQHAPGQQWAYNNAAVQTLDAVLKGATGMSVAEFAQKRLFEPLGMAHTRMSLDGSGNTLMYMSLMTTCQDLARFGLLLLHEGKWGTKQIVSSEYVSEATSVSSTKMNVGYGFLFWINHKGPIGDPLVATDLAAVAKPNARVGQLAPGAPSDLFWAIGLGNQIVQVDPGSGTVVVRLGEGGVRPTPPTFGPKEASRVVTQAVRH